MADALHDEKGDIIEGRGLVTRLFACIFLELAVRSQLLGLPGAKQSFQKGTLYEIIPAGEPIRFFCVLDLELERPVDDSAHEFLLSMLSRASKEWLRQSSDDGRLINGKPVEAKLAESCEGSRFSCYLVTSIWVADIQVQARAAMLSFAAFLKFYFLSMERSREEHDITPHFAAELVNAGVRNSGERYKKIDDTSELELIVGAACEAVSTAAIFDTSVYNADCAVRMLGSCILKPGVGLVWPLYPTKRSGGNFVEMMSREAKKTFIDPQRKGNAAITVEEVIEYMVIPGDLWGAVSRK